MASIHPMLQPFGTGPGETYTAGHAVHLLNRAGFGGTPEQVRRVRALGAVAAVEELLGFADAPARAQDPTDLPDFSPLNDYPHGYASLRKLSVGKNEDERRMIRQQFQAANRRTLMNVAHWWLGRMGGGKHPLQEKLTLFWHGHFTTSARDERLAQLMWDQNELLRRQAAGNFKQFVLDISRDPAMLDYLNNNQNRKQHPNENYARELMELFTLGIGNYTEQDVKEAARAFTGWAHDGEKFVFRRTQHDTGDKTFLGQTGALDGKDVIDIIFRQPACAPFICRKLYAFFVQDPPDEALVGNLADLLRENGWNLRPVLRMMLASRAFYRPQTIGQQIKSPLQLVVGTLHLLELPVPDPRRLVGALTQMGQVPFHPPNVKGWAGGRAWINTATLLARYNAAVNLAAPVDPARLDPDPDALLARLIGRPIAADKRQVLVEMLKADGSKTGIRKAIQLIVAMPEYQLC